MTYSPPTLLGELWPFFILGRMDRPEEDTSVLELMCPDTPAGLYETYYPVFADTNPTAALGLELTVQGPLGERELEIWCKVFRTPRLTGHRNESLDLPDWLFVEQRPLSGLTHVLMLPLWQRQDIFLYAMHQRGLS